MEATILPKANIGSKEPLAVKVLEDKTTEDLSNKIDKLQPALNLDFIKNLRIQFETFSDSLSEKMSSIADTFSKMGGSDIKDGFDKLSSGLGFLGPFVTIAKDIIEKITGVFQIVKGVGKLIGNAIGGVVGGVKNIAGNVFGIESSDEDAGEDNKQAIEDHTEAVVNATEEIKGASKEEGTERKKFNKGLNKFNMTIPLIIAAIVAVIFAFKNNMFAALGQIAKDIATRIGSVGQAIKSGIDNSVKAISDGATKLKDKFAKSADDVAKGLKARFPQATDKVKDAVTKTKDVVKGGLEKGKNFFQRVGSGIKNATGGAIDKVKSGAKAVAENTGRAGSVVKNVAKTVVKKLPVIGAIAEGGLDVKDNTQRFNVIKEAYENEVPIVPVDPNNPDAGKRPITKEEFEEQEQIYKASIAGSVGKGGGAAAGASVGAAAGASIGSVIPVFGTIAGGIIGAVIGGFLGGEAGDKIGTELAESVRGVDNANELNSSLVQAATQYMKSEKLESANGEIADMKSENASSKSTTTQVVAPSSVQNVQNSYDIGGQPAFEGISP